MIYNRKTDNVFINYDQIWSVLQKDFELNYNDTQQLTEDWVGVVYNLREASTGPFINQERERWE